MEKTFHYQLLDKLLAILCWKGDENIEAVQSAASGLWGGACAGYAS